MNVIFTCGGTGGHINPAIAVANILKERYPDANILFIGAAGEMEENLVPRAGYRLIGLPSANLWREKTLYALKRNIQGVGDLMKAIRACKKIFQEFQPDVIVGTGGYASFPALYAGSRMGIPTCVHESNAVPGLTTKLIANRVDRMLVALPESAQYYKRSKHVQVIGMPVRREFIYTKREDARRELNLDDRPLIVSAFGSLGAREMNKVIGQVFCLEKEENLPFQHIHATGNYGWEWMPEYVKSLGLDLNDCPGLDMREYIYNMPTVMAAADVIIGRAGASSCNEIAAAGTPCILIPSPNVTNHHQEKNAQVYADQGAAVLLPEQECTARRLYDEIKALIADEKRRAGMKAALQKTVVPDSAEQICGIIEELAKH